MSEKDQGLVHITRQNGSLSQFDFDPNVAGAILRSFGKIPEFGVWRARKFRMVSLDLVSGRFTIESPSTGPIDYALVQRRDGKAVARRCISGLEPEETAGRIIDYWGGNYQQRYEIDYGGNGTVLKSVINFYYVNEPHEINILQMAPLGSITFFLAEPEQEPVIHINMIDVLIQNIITAAQSDIYSHGARFDIRIKGEPIQAMMGSNNRVTLGQWFRAGSDNLEYCLMREEFIMVLAKREKVSKIIREDLTFPVPNSVDPEALGKIAQSEDWTKVDSYFLAYILAA